jgi:hypothetical protein
MNDELIPYSTIVSMVQNWETNQAKILRACEMISEVKSDLVQVFGDDLRFYRSDVNVEQPKESVDKIRIKIWKTIINKSEIRRFLSVKEAEALDKKLEEGMFPEVTIEEVMNVVKSAMANIQNFADDMVIETFNFLRPNNLNQRRDQYRNNIKFQGELGKRVVLHWVNQRYLSDKYSVRYHYEKEVRAVDNVFHALDGKGFTASYYGDLHNAIEGCTGSGETEYFKFRCYMNGNLHLEFKRMDLVKKMNAIVTKNVLKEKN